MDEMNKNAGPGSPSGTGAESSPATNGGSFAPQTTARIITSKRVVIPADVKRSVKRAKQAAGAPAEAPDSRVFGESIPVEPPAPEMQAASSASTEHIVPEQTLSQETVPTVGERTDIRATVPGINAEPATAKTETAPARGAPPSHPAHRADETVFETSGETAKPKRRWLKFALWGIAILLLIAIAILVIPLIFPNLF